MMDPEVEDLIVALTKQGKSAPYIAEMIGVTDRTVTRVRAKRGISQHSNRTDPLTDDEKRTAAALLDDGASVAEVARTLVRHPKTIYKHFPGRAWDKQQCGQYAAWHNTRTRGKLS